MKIVEPSFSNKMDSSKSTRLSEVYTVGDFKTLGSPAAFNGDEIIILRCAETIAEVFPDWTSRANLSETSLIPFDINCPIELAQRADMRRAYAVDPPLSELGKIAAKMMGREIAERKLAPSVIYATPDLASVETAAIIQKFIGVEKCAKIRIEPELSTMHRVAGSFFGRDHFLRQGVGIDVTTAPLNAVSHGTEMEHLVLRIKRAFYELTTSQENALMIVDPLSAKIIASLFYGIEFKPKANVDEEHLVALANFPPLSSFSTFRVPGSGNKMYDITSVTLRPLTYTGFSSNIDLD